MSKSELRERDLGIDGVRETVALGIVGAIIGMLAFAAAYIVAQMDRIPPGLPIGHVVPAVFYATYGTTCVCCSSCVFWVWITDGWERGTPFQVLRFSAKDVLSVYAIGLIVSICISVIVLICLEEPQELHRLSELGMSFGVHGGMLK